MSSFKKKKQKISHGKRNIQFINLKEFHWFFSGGEKTSQKKKIISFVIKHCFYNIVILGTFFFFPFLNLDDIHQFFSPHN